MLLRTAESLTVDDALELAGGWSLYQRRLMFYLGAVQACSASHMLAPIFLIPQLSTDAEWRLTASGLSLLSSAFFVGYCVGVVLWAAISDSRGRRPATTWAFTLGNLSGILSFFAPTYTAFVMLRCLCGVGVAGSKNGCFLMATEFAPPAARARVGALVSYAWLTGLLFLVFTAWLLQNWHWRWLVLTYVPASALQLVLGGLLPESPRFLLVIGEAERAKATILAIFATNGRAPPEPMTLRRPPMDEAKAEGAGAEEGQRDGKQRGGRDGHACAQLWQRRARQRTCIVGFCQGVCTMVFYALTFDPRTNAAAGNLYLGALLGALVELPAYILLAPVTNTYGRRLSYSCCLALTALCLLAMNAFLDSDSGSSGPGDGGVAAPTSPEDIAADANAAADAPTNVADVTAATKDGAPRPNWPAMAAALGGRFASVAATNVAYIVAAELFPTSCRNAAVGWSSGGGRFGAIIAPALMLSAEHPLLIFMALSLAAAAMVLLLPESAGMSLADVPEHPCAEADGGGGGAVYHRRRRTCSQESGSSSLPASPSSASAEVK